MKERPSHHDHSFFNSFTRRISLGYSVIQYLKAIKN